MYIQIKNLSKKYNENIAVNNISLNVKKGEIFGIIGLSGAGKSTLIKMINKLETPDNGEIIVNDENILKYSDKELREYRKKTAMIFQNFNLLTSRTVFENVSLALEISNKSKEYIKEKVNSLLKLVNLYEYKDKYINNLSGGQKQRVAIARALANDPDILLSDESTSSLDPITSNSILDLIKKINKELGITVILITHQMEVIKKICDRVAVMKDGNILELSTVKELFLNPKNEFSKKLIEDVKLELPKGRKNTIKINFDGEEANIPYMSLLTKKFDIEINILGGSIDTLANGSKVGHLIVELETENIKDIINWLREHKIEVEVINND